MGYILNREERNKFRKKLRNNMPKAEIILWSQLKGKKLDGFKFRRQHSVGPFIVDFYCPKLKLAIEVDGDSHYQEGIEEYDKRREKYIRSYYRLHINFRCNGFSILDCQNNQTRY